MTLRKIVQTVIYVVVIVFIFYTALIKEQRPLTDDEINRISEAIGKIIKSDSERDKPITPKTITDATKATYRISIGRSGCSATLIDYDSNSRRYIGVTAAHCIDDVRQTVYLYTHDNTKVRCSVLGVDKEHDAAVIATEPTHHILYIASVSRERKPNGTRVCHMGYGVDKPANRECGTITGYSASDGQYISDISVSSGDSGSGVWCADTGEIVGTVCCIVRHGAKTWTQFTDISYHLEILKKDKHLISDIKPVEMPLHIK